VARLILLVHGPNLNLLGEREPGVYGRTRLAEINRAFAAQARKLGYRTRAYQSNSEGALIDFLHRNRKVAAGIVINPGAYTHYSYALRDAVSAVNLPAVEVHLSDIRKREPFRRVSVIREVCIAQVSGLGPRSYTEGLKLLVRRLEKASARTSARRAGSRAR
jgi:3-dehydroquinate dehydratase-2